MRIKDFLEMERKREEDELGCEDDQSTNQESHGYRKRFIIGAAAFLMASAAFMGTEFAVVVGITLIFLALCVNVLMRGQEG